MGQLARGKYARAISDRSGMEFPYKEMVKEWNGSFVHVSEYEAKHPQLEPNHPGPDPTALYQPRVDGRSEVTVENLLGLNPFTSTASSAVITVLESSHGRSTSDTVRFRNASSFDGFTKTVLENASGYSITKIDDNRYSFTASSGTATSGTKGGGGRVTAGPVTLGA